MSASYLSASAVCARWGVSRATLYRRIRDGCFPKPVRFAGRIVRWSVRELEDFEARLNADRGGAEVRAS